MELYRGIVNVRGPDPVSGPRTVLALPGGGGGMALSEGAAAGLAAVHPPTSNAATAVITQAATATISASRLQIPNDRSPSRHRRHHLPFLTRAGVAGTGLNR